MNTLARRQILKKSFPDVEIVGIVDHIDEYGQGLIEDPSTAMLFYFNGKIDRNFKLKVGSRVKVVVNGIDVKEFISLINFTKVLSERVD